MQMGGDWFYGSLLYWYYVRFISWWESKDHTDPAQCKKCAVDFSQIYTVESTHQKKIIKKKCVEIWLHYAY